MPRRRYRIRAGALPALAVFFILPGCGGPYTITVRSVLDQSLARVIDTNVTERVSFSFTSRVADGVVRPYSRDKKRLPGEHPGYEHREVAALRDLVTAYMRRKFALLGPGPAKTTITLSLEKFHVEQYAVDSYGNFTPGTPLNTAPTIKIAAFLEATLTVAVTGEFTVNKNLSIESPERFARPVSRNEPPDAIYKGDDSLQARHAAVIAAANTRLVKAVNGYLEEIGF